MPHKNSAYFINVFKSKHRHLRRCKEGRFTSHGSSLCSPVIVVYFIDANDLTSSQSNSLCTWIMRSTINAITILDLDVFRTRKKHGNEGNLTFVSLVWSPKTCNTNKRQRFPKALSYQLVHFKCSDRSARDFTEDTSDFTKW